MELDFRLNAILTVQYLAIFLLMGLTTPSMASAQLASYDWKPIPMQSGEVSNIVVSPTNPDVMFLGIEVNSHSAYKSTDRGKTWKRIHSYDHNKDVVVHPTNSDIVLLADSQQIWRSTTGGEGNERTGEAAHGGPPSAFENVLKNNSAPGPSESSFSTLVYAPSNPSAWYAAVRGSQGGRGGFSDGKPHVWKSTDTGKTWTDVDGKYPSTILVFEVDPKDENHIFAGSDEGVYESTDGAKNFKQIDGAGHVPSITTLDGQLWLAGSSEGILRSENGGKSWTKISQGLPNKNVFRVDIVRDNPNVVWATTYNGVARSTDSGKTWQDSSGDLPAKNLQALVVDPTNPNLAIVATETFVFSVRSESKHFQQGQYFRQGIYRTENGGKTWQRSDGGLIEENVLDVTSHPTRPYEVWASQQASRGLYRSRDAGQTWSLSPHLLTHYPMRTAFFPGSDDKLAHTSLHIGEDFGVSTDSGVNWTIQSQDTFFESLNRGKSLFDRNKKDGANLHLHGLAIDPKNPDIVYVGSVDDPSTFNQKAVKGAHIFKSTDGGKTWTESDEGYDHEYATSINDIKIDPQNTSTLYIAMTRKESTNGNGVWKSIDAAKTWQRANTGMPDNASVSTLVIHPNKTNQLLAATFEGLYRSSDGGATWTRKKSGTFKDIEFDPSNPEIVYTGSGPEGPSREGKNGMFLSTDFGETWTDITNDLPSTKVTSVAVSANGKLVYAGTEEKGLFAAIDSLVGSVPIDTITKTELGSDRGGGLRDRDREGEYATSHGMHQPNGFDSDPQPPEFLRKFGEQYREPPTWFKAVVGGVILLFISSLVWLLIKLIKRKRGNNVQ